MNDGRIAYVGGTVYANWPWCHLADSHDVGKLSFGDPCLFDYNLLLDKREHGIATSKVEQSDIGKD